jgi:hypothetical protein
MEPITFGFQAGAVEHTGPSGGYHLILPGFLSAMIDPKLKYISYGFQPYAAKLEAHGIPTSSYFYTIPCDGILQAYCIILHLIEKHKRFEFLPEHLKPTIDSNNQPNGEVE